LPYIAFNKDAFPNRLRVHMPRRLNQIIQLAKTSPVFLAWVFKLIIRLSFASRSVSGAALSAIAL